MGKPPDDRSGTAPPGRATDIPAPGSIDGALFQRLFADACELLHRHVPALNAVNVFPVPDGDTGTNMYLTLRAGLDGMSGQDVSAAARSLAHGALMGARGNSGVILSQVLRGLSVGLDGRHEADGLALAGALAAARDAAYEALSEPVEGTILTVVREASASLEHDPPAAVDAALARAVQAAKTAVERTPELLPVLREAGVVDAGALGLSIILEGLLRSLRGEALDVDLAPEAAVGAGWRDKAASLHEAHQGETGYCTEFMVSSDAIDAGAVREHLATLGTSLLVVGGGELLRVHVHTVRPDDALAYGRTLGELSHVKVDNMEAQIRRFVDQEELSKAVASGIDVVAVAAGEGIEAAFRSVGVTHLVHGGQTMNPSAGEILSVIEACPSADVVVLPNNKNIIASAEQAAEQSRKRVAVVPSRSIPQGVAAVLALNPDLPFDANAEAMERALASVRSAEVTRAARATTIDGRHIGMGQAIGIVEGKLQVVADGIASATEQCIAQMLTPEASLLTVYAGEEVREDDAGALVETLRARYPEVEVELVMGGQPHYPYILSLE